MSNSKEDFIEIINQSSKLKKGILSTTSAEFALTYIDSSPDLIQLHNLYVLIKEIESYYQNKHKDYQYNCNFEHVMFRLLEEIYQCRLYDQTPDKQGTTLYEYLISVIDNMIILSDKGLYIKQEYTNNTESVTGTSLYKLLKHKQLEYQNEDSCLVDHPKDDLFLQHYHDILSHLKECVKSESHDSVFEVTNG